MESESNQKRLDILAYAKRLADDGAHYLWGAQGDKPTANGAIKCIRLSTSTLLNKKISA